MHPEATHGKCVGPSLCPTCHHCQFYSVAAGRFELNSPSLPVALRLLLLPFNFWIQGLLKVDFHQIAKMCPKPAFSWIKYIHVGQIPRGPGTTSSARARRSLCSRTFQVPDSSEPCVYGQDAEPGSSPQLSNLS